MGVCRYGGGGISVQVLGVGTGTQEGQESPASLSGNTAVGPAGLVLRLGNQAHRARNRAAFIRQPHRLPLGAGPLYLLILLN